MSAWSGASTNSSWVVQGFGNLKDERESRQVAHDRRRIGNPVDGGPVGKVFPQLDFKNRDAFDGDLVAQEGENQVAAGDGDGWLCGKTAGPFGNASPCCQKAASA